MKREKENLFKKILNTSYIRFIIFSNVKEIHNIIYNEKLVNKYRWKDLIISPTLLLTFNYIDIYKTIFKEQLLQQATPISLQRINYLYLESLTKAAKIGRLDVIEFIYQYFERDEIDFQLIFKQALHYGHLSILKYIRELFGDNSNIWFGRSSIDSAARSGYLNIVQYLYEELNILPSKNIIDIVASYGYLSLVKYFTEVQKELLNRTILDNSIKQWCTKSAMDYSAGGGHIEIIKYLHYHRTEGCTGHAIMRASENGHLQVVEFLHNNRTESTFTLAMNSAAKNGHLDVVKFLDTHRTEGATQYAMNMAATNGHFEIVKYLHTHRTEGCNFDALDGAIRNGHLHIIQYLVENTSYFPTTSNSAIDDNDKPILIDEAAQRGFFDIVRYLHFNCTSFCGCTVNAINIAAASDSNLPIIEFLLNNRTEGYTQEAMDYAGVNGALQNLKFLHNHSGVRCSPKVLLLAARSGYLEMVKFLKENESVYSLTNSFDYLLDQISPNTEIFSYLSSAIRPDRSLSNNTKK